MQYQKGNQTYLLLIEKDELLIATIKKFVSEEQIGAASFIMLGAVKDVTLGYVPHNSSDYVWNEFKGQYELVNGTGLIAWDKDTNEPFIHCHATISGEEFTSFGGHLQGAKVALMAEVTINIISEEKIYKSLNDKINLKTLKLANK